MATKLVKSLEDAIRACGLCDGMTIDFHHHLRAGDKVTALVVNTISRMGLKDITMLHSGVFDDMMEQGLQEALRTGVITCVECSGNTSQIMGTMISRGQIPNICRFHTHGGRPRTIIEGKVSIDIVFVAAPTADRMGNYNGVEGPSACGSLGYTMTSVRHAKHTIVITDNLVPYPLQRVTVDESFVDCVVQVDSIGDPKGIATGTAKNTRDPIALKLGEYAAAAIKSSGLMKDGFSYQAGAGGPSIATTHYIRDYMEEMNIHGSYILGGITGHSVDLLNAGLFEGIQDVQCFDLHAVESLRNNPLHKEISDSCYANPGMKSCAVDNLDVVVLGAKEIDVNFNCNLVLNSRGILDGGSGGHSDVAQAAKLSMIVAPLMRTRFPTVMEKVTSITTPGSSINALVTEYGVAINDNCPELRQRLIDNKVKVVDIHDLQRLAYSMTGKPKEVKFGDRVVAEIVHRGEYVIDYVHNIIED